MSRTSLDLIDAPIYEPKLVENFDAVVEHYALGWRCVAAYVDGDDDDYYVLERPVR
jgi:hypothetical protein